jgi:hypothetical protein
VDAIALLAGSRQLQDELDLAIGSVEREMFDATIARLRLEIGDAQFERQWEASAAASLEDMIGAALLALADLTETGA